MTNTIKIVLSEIAGFSIITTGPLTDYCIVLYLTAAGKLYKHRLLDGIRSLKGK